MLFVVASEDVVGVLDRVQGAGGQNRWLDYISYDRTQGRDKCLFPHTGDTVIFAEAAMGKPFPLGFDPLYDSLVKDARQFQLYFGYFTGGLFEGWPESLWENVIVAGGAVAACLYHAPAHCAHLRSQVTVASL